MSHIASDYTRLIAGTMAIKMQSFHRAMPQVPFQYSVSIFIPDSIESIVTLSYRFFLFCFVRAHTEDQYQDFSSTNERSPTLDVVMKQYFLVPMSKFINAT